MADLENCGFAPWLEETLPAIVELNPETIAISARNGEKDMVFTAYFNCNAEDKSVLAHHILSDVVMDIVMSNRELIINGEEGEEETETVD